MYLRCAIRRQAAIVVISEQDFAELLARSTCEVTGRKTGSFNWFLKRIQSACASSTQSLKFCRRLRSESVQLTDDHSCSYTTEVFDWIRTLTRTFLVGGAIGSFAPEKI